MKNNLKYILLAFLTIGLYSCDDEAYSLEGDDIGGNSILKDTKISVFDTNEDLKIELLSADGLTVDSLVVNKDGSKIADATINGENATFSSSTLGAFVFGDDKDEPTGSFDVNFKSTLSNGQTFLNDYTIKVVKAITVSEEQETVKYLDTTSQKIVFESFTKHATIDTRTVEWKKGKNGTYKVDPKLIFDENELTIELNQHDYATTYSLVAKDTLYYKVTLTSGALTDLTETSIAIEAQEMEASKAGVLSKASPLFNFTDPSSNIGEIEFTSPEGLTVIAEVSKELEFVEITLPSGVSAVDYFTAGDIVDAKEQFTNGTGQTTLASLTKDMIYVYKITRVEQNEDDEDVSQTFYGLLKIGDVITTNNNADKEINFDYKEGSIIGE